MNIFFTINTELFSSYLSIPKFNNLGKYLIEPIIICFEIDPVKNVWNIEQYNCDEDESFFYVDSNLTKRNFFSIIEKKNFKETIQISELINFDKTGDKKPSFRCNLKVITKNNSFSSYQSEYPFHLVKNNANILSPLKVLNNQNRAKNLIIFPNISSKPDLIQKNGKIMSEDKKILKEFNLYTNQINTIDITELNQNSYFCSYNISGIPIFISLDQKGNITIEHTHPPHAFLDIEDKFLIINSFKNKFK